MSIRSVDMQVLVQKVGEIARIQQAQGTSANQRQSEFSQLITAQTVAQRHTVQESNDPEAKTMQKKESKHQDRQQQGERRGGDEARQDQDQAIFRDYHKGNTIDIKI